MPKNSGVGLSGKATTEPIRENIKKCKNKRGKITLNLSSFFDSAGSLMYYLTFSYAYFHSFIEQTLMDQLLFWDLGI